jgi:hypothetical protein
MINEDEFSQPPEYTPNKQLSQESTQQSCQSSQINEACNNDLEEPDSEINPPKRQVVLQVA